MKCIRECSSWKRTTSRRSRKEWDTMKGTKKPSLRIGVVLIMAAVFAMTTQASGTANGSLRSTVNVAAQDSGCKLMFDALDKLTSTPNHFYATETGGAKNKPTNSEGILASGIRYIKVDGKWMKSPMSSQEVREQEQKNRQDVKNNYSCRYMRDEFLHGESAAVFSAHQKNGDFTTDAQIWISKSKGLVLREEEDMDVGGGASGKSHLSIRYEYSNVQAPLISQ